MKKSILLLTIFVFLQACQRDSLTVSPTPSQDEFALSLKEAETIALKGALQNVQTSTNARVEGGIEILESKTIKDSTDESSLFHIIKFKDKKGFRVIAADKQFVPLLAHGDAGEFDETFPGTNQWVAFVVGYLHQQKIKDKDDENKYKKNSKLWDTFEKTGFPFIKDPKEKGKRIAIPEPGPYPCASAHWVVPGLVASNWWQGSVHNNLFGYSSCNSAGYCNRLPAGCGAIAISQIIRANAVNGRGGPSGYNFGSMPLFSNSCGPYSFGELESGRLVKDAANAVGSFAFSIYLPFYCTSSTATYPWGIPSGFSQMGYSNGGNYGDFYPSYQSIVSDIINGYPVIMSGKKGWIGNLNSWHIWVIDGIDRNMYTDWDGNCVVYDFFKCNWGWGNAPLNGEWYWYGNGSYNGYNTELRAVTNIRP